MKGRKEKQKPRLLVVGDFPHETGFGRVVSSLITEWEQQYDIFILGINYFGDFHPLTQRFKAFPAVVGGDVYGIKRLPELLQKILPQFVFVVQDPWIAKEYIEVLKAYKEQAPPDYPIVRALYTPIDALGVKSLYIEPLNDGFDVIFPYTVFGETELKKAGLKKPTHVIPHGVNVNDFYPQPKLDTRVLLNIPPTDYIVGMVARNSLRKRIDLAFYYFSEWVKQYNLPESVKFYYHGSLHDSGGYDILHLARIFGVHNRLILTSMELRPDELVPIEHMNRIYNTFDVHWMTSTGEG